MSDFLNTMSTFFAFVFEQLSNFFDLLVTTTFGQIILGVVFIEIIFWIGMLFISQIKK